VQAQASKVPESGYFSEVDPKGAAGVSVCETHELLALGSCSCRAPCMPNRARQAGTTTAPGTRPALVPFSLAAAEVYPVKSGLDTDVTKRGGRYQSDFIWNTNWKDKVGGGVVCYAAACYVYYAGLQCY
jgi:hypothetical protein